MFEKEIRVKIQEMTASIDRIQGYTIDNKQSVKMDIVTLQQSIDERIKQIEARSSMIASGYISSKDMMQASMMASQHYG